MARFYWETFQPKRSSNLFKSLNYTHKRIKSFHQFFLKSPLEVNAYEHLRIFLHFLFNNKGKLRMDSLKSKGSNEELAPDVPPNNKVR